MQKCEKLTRVKLIYNCKFTKLVKTLFRFYMMLSLRLNSKNYWFIGDLCIFFDCASGF